MLKPSNDRVFVIIPAFNERVDILENCVADILSCSYRVIVVDDGSKEKIVLKPSPSVTVIRHAVNLGQGAALMTGIQYALSNNAMYIVTFDSDGQHSVKDISNLLQPLLVSPTQITLGSRFLEPGKHNASLPRQILLKVAIVVNYIFTGLYLTDAHNGLRAMKREAAARIKLTENRMAHATEILLCIKKNKLVFQEIPTTVLYTNYSKEKGQSSLASIKIFFDLLLHKLFR